MNSLNPRKAWQCRAYPRKTGRLTIIIGADDTRPGKGKQAGCGKERTASALCFLYLRNVKGFAWNHKRVYHIHRELELNLRVKTKKRPIREDGDRFILKSVISLIGRKKR